MERDGQRLFIAATLLNGMISSAPVATDRSKVNKAIWARIALDWADALMLAHDEDAQEKSDAVR